MNNDRLTKVVGRASSRAASKDRLSKARRSWNMSRIRGKHTTPEKLVRSLLHRMGCRFRLHVRIPLSKEGSRKRARRVLPAKHAKYAKTGPRTALSAFHPSADNPRSATHALRFTVPDIILPRYKTAIFVHGFLASASRLPELHHAHAPARLLGQQTRRQCRAGQSQSARSPRTRVETVIVWECDVDRPKSLDRLTRKLEKLLKQVHHDFRDL